MTGNPSQSVQYRPSGELKRKPVLIKSDWNPLYPSKSSTLLTRPFRLAPRFPRRRKRFAGYCIVLVGVGVRLAVLQDEVLGREGAVDDKAQVRAPVPVHIPPQHAARKAQLPGLPVNAASRAEPSTQGWCRS